MRICVLLECNMNYLRGSFMAIHNRMKYLIKEPSIEVCIYNFLRYYDPFTNFVRGYKHIDKKEEYVIDGIHYHCYYYKRSYIDYFLRSISNYQTTIEVNRVKKYKNLFKQFDICFAHSLYTGL